MARKNWSCRLPPRANSSTALRPSRKNVVRKRYLSSGGAALSRPAWTWRSTTGRIAAALRKAKKLAGRSENDIWIAATARSLGARLLTRNAQDFRGIDGLEVLSYGR
jgi:predicted nucleic acid-binding protein